MTYNIVLTNVPFNENQNVHNGVKHKKQGRNLAKEFIYKCLDWADENLYVIAPVSRTYTSKVKRDFIAEGLYEVSNVKKYFPRVKVDLIACYSFDKKNRKQLNDCTVFEIPERNLGQIYTFTTGENIGNKKLEKILSDKGKYKIFLTTGNIKYTDSEEIVEMINDRTRGRLRVVMNHNASKSNVGNMHIAYPEDILTYSTNAFFIESVEQGNSIIEYLQSEEAKEILLKTRRSMSNSKTSFSAFPIPF